MKNKILSQIAALAFTFIACNEIKTTETTTTEPAAIPNLSYTVVGTFPHDTTLFTEGLEFVDGKLFESTGSPEELFQTESKIVMVDTVSGKAINKVKINKNLYFGEGMTSLNGKVYQVTYKTQLGFVYDQKTFKKLKDFTYQNVEGWGLTNDGKNLIMSEGTHLLTYFDPETLAVVKTLSVKENAYAKNYINELEYVDGFIYANIWQSDELVKIDVNSGDIVAKINLSDLKNQATRKSGFSMETNGIAYDKTSKTFVVTGKMWPMYFKIKI